MRHRVLTVAALALAVGVLAGRPAAAEPITVFSNLSAGANYTAGYWDILERTVAFGFVPGSDVALGGLELSLARPLDTQPFLAGDAIVRLHESSGTAPGAVLESFAVEADDLSEVTSAFPLVRLTSTSGAFLRGGRTYWIAVTTPKDLIYWVSASERYLGPAAFRTNETDDWYVADRNGIGGLRVFGDPAGVPTPEPAALVLFGSGAALLWSVRRATCQAARRRISS